MNPMIASPVVHNAHVVPEPVLGVSEAVSAATDGRVKPGHDDNTYGPFFSRFHMSGLRAVKPCQAKGLACRAHIFIAAALLGLFAKNAFAGPALVIEMRSGNVLYEDHPTELWYPASVTKLMTAYVALSAVRDHRIALDTPLAVSARAASMPPSKMGFHPGTLVTLDNALKMLMVKSANDMAVTIAEGVSGSVEAFADDMNDAARKLGLTQSHFVNPNGLPNPEHISSARDLAILARALYLTFPEEASLFNIGALQFDGKIIRNHNDLLGRYPGADGMKTGFTCAAGFNIVASATQGGRKFIAVILGAPNARSRAAMAATLFDRAFAGIDMPSRLVNDLAASADDLAAPPDMQQAACRNRGKAVAKYNKEIEQLMAPLLTKVAVPTGHSVVTTTEALSRPAPVALRMAMVPTPAFDPVPVHVGPEAGYNGLVAQVRPPHSPIGTAPPPESVSANAPTAPESESVVGDMPLTPDPKALPLRSESKHALASLTHHHASHGHRLGRAQASAAKGLAAKKTGHKAPQKLTKTAQGKAPAKQAHAAKAGVTKHAKTVAKPGAKTHTAAKPAAHASKSPAKKPEKHATR
jgi:D-alanyl-D-alanine carboxypeptidase